MKKILSRMFSAVITIAVFAAIAIRIYAALALSVFSAAWMPDDVELYACVRDNGDRLAMMVDGEGHAMYSIQWKLAGQDFIGYINKFEVHGQSPNKLFDRIYLKNTGLFGLRIAPAGYNVDLVELKCVDQQTIGDAINPIGLNETFTDTWFINEDSLILKNGIQKTVLYNIRSAGEDYLDIYEEFELFLS